MNTLVHEEKFRGLPLLQKMAEQEFIICGAGAIGSNLVENMVRQGFKKFTVDDHNRHTQAYNRRGQLKVNALKTKGRHTRVYEVAKTPGDRPFIRFPCRNIII